MKFILHNLTQSAVVSLILSSISFSQVKLETKVDKTDITIGDRVAYSVLVTRSEKEKIELPGPGANLGAFEIKDYQVLKPVNKAGRVIEQTDYSIAVFDTGKYVIPPMAVRYTVAGDTGNIWRILMTDPITLHVKSVLRGEKASDIRDIKPPLELPFDPKKWIFAGMAILALTGIGLLVYRFLKKKGEPILPKKMEPVRPPHEIAFEELEKLKASSLIPEGRIKEYYIEISEIIRRYIEARFLVLALELTTQELVDNLIRENMARDHIELVEKFLNECDLVKFAKYKPNQTEIDSIGENAWEIIENTKLLLMPVETEMETIPTVAGSTSVTATSGVKE